MLKKLSLALLILVLVSAMGMAAEYQEAPELKEMVEEGELPTVEERIPENPKVFEPVTEIGEYGGTVNFIQHGEIEGRGMMGHILVETLMFRTVDDEITSNIAEDWELSEDAKTFIFEIREGIRWSDGEPLTADDVMFWYEDILLNEELTPSIPPIWRPGGEVVEVKKVGEYTVEFNFARPWPGVVTYLSDPRFPAQGLILHPKHYLKEFHIDYNSDADELAEEEGFTEWFELFEHKASHGRGSTHPDLPTLSAWLVEEDEPGTLLYKRNPYYWKVDPEGKQLPYIDYVNGQLAEDGELRAMKVMAGDVDYVTIHEIGIDKYPMLMQRKDDLNYEVILEDDVDQASAAAVFFNRAIEDKFLNNLFDTPEFAQALSLAIDREEIKEIAYLGQADARQATISPDHPAFEEKFAEAYADYDPQRAREKLDNLGLEQDDDGYYLREDNGERIHLVLSVPDFIAEHAQAAELVVDYWEDVGIETTMDLGADIWQLAQDNTLEVGMWLFQARKMRMIQQPAWWTKGILWAWNWNIWFESDGDAGVEPHPWAKEFLEDWYEYPYIPDEEERIEHAKELLEIFAERLPFIGTVGLPKNPRAWKNYLINVPDSPYLHKTEAHVDRTYAFQFYLQD